MGKFLYLVRHAKSSWKYPSLTDMERPLNKRGQNDILTMTLRLKQKNIAIDSIISSPSERTKLTAMHLAREQTLRNHILFSDALYHADLPTLLSIIRQFRDAQNAVLLVGHNPGLTDLANILGGLNIANIPTCGIVGFALPISSWSDIHLGMARLLFFDFPKNKQL